MTLPLRVKPFLHYATKGHVKKEPRILPENCFKAENVPCDEKSGLLKGAVMSGLRGSPGAACN